MNTLQEMVNSLLDKKSFNVVSWKENGKLNTINNQEIFETILHSSKGLLELDLKHGQRVALFSDNSPHWFELCLAINYAGLIDVPRGSDSTQEEIDYILDHSKAKLVIVQNKAIYDKVKNSRKLEQILSIEDIEGVKNVKYLEEIGIKSIKKIPKAVESDVASIIYTSGTTGKPKGVELTHGNFTSNAVATLHFLGDISEDKMISLLPPWHVFGRMEKYVALIGGVEMFYTTPKNVLQDLAEQKPSIMVSVPRIWEAVYDKFTKNPAIKKINGIKSEWLKNKLLGYLVPKALKKKLGGNLRLVVSGGGGLPEHIDRFFDDNGLEVLEGYGMTETSPVISARVLGSHAYGTVGKPLEKITIEIRDEHNKVVKDNVEGTIYVKGPNVMRGYHKDMLETWKVMGRDHFLNTGDLGYINSDGNLVITGREKELIVLRGGENIHPTKVEEALLTSQYITSAIVVGEEWKEGKKKSEPWSKLGVLIVPDLENLENYCKENKISFSKENPYSTLDNPDVKSLYKNEIAKYVNNNKQTFKACENVFSMSFVPPFEVGRELTGSFKPKRVQIIREYHKDKIEKMSKEINRK
ncbi:MAG: AMP-binding protein [Nanoarchaeota archaeon]|nr:AMP-binding protein [Nanoarchaeota archaeon]